MPRRILLATATLFPAMAQAATQIAQSVTTLAAQQDQNTLCPPAATVSYPAQFTWAARNTEPPARGAQVSDNLTPRIEQWHAGAAAPAVVWSSLDSNTATCQELFLPPTAPSGGMVTFNGASYPYATVELPNGVAEPIFSDPLLQAFANTGCGPFGNAGHIDLFRMWQPGDTFKIFPAVYDGVIQLQPRPDYFTGATVPVFPPTNITLQGMTIAGIRPTFLRTGGGQGDSESAKDVLELAESANITIDNIEIGLAATGSVALGIVFDTNSGVLLHDANGTAVAKPIFGGTTTISHSRVFGGELQEAASGGANGIVGGLADPVGKSGLGGTLALLHDEIAQNGGSGVQNASGIGHNVYLPSGLDPNFTVIAQSNWSHDAYYGHLFKSRAQKNIITGNYFQGGLPQGGIYQQAETYDLDIPNGGVLQAKDNIFVKTRSGANSNGFSIAYAEEGIPDARKLSLDIENNTFVAFSATFDGSYPNVPFFFFYPAQNPTIAGFPVLPGATTIQHNAFVGYCPTLWNSVQNYLGDVSATEGFSELTQQFRFTSKYTPAGNTSIIGTKAYSHIVVAPQRTAATIGAKD